MSSVTSVGVDIRLLIEQAAAADKAVDYKALIARLGKNPSAAELSQVAEALDAEVKDGTIDATRAKFIMSNVEGKLLADNIGDASVIKAAAGTLGDLSMTDAQVDKATARILGWEDRAKLSQDLVKLGKDDDLSTSDFATIWQDAIGRDGQVDAHDVAQVYQTLDNMLKNGKITQTQYTAMVASADTALAKERGAAQMTTGAKSYLDATFTAHKVDGSTVTATDPKTWQNLIDFLTFQLPSGKRLPAGTVSAFIDQVYASERPISDATAGAVATALKAEVANGTISQADAQRIAHGLDARIAFQRYGVGAKADFSLVQAQITPASTDAASTSDSTRGSTDANAVAVST